MVKYNTEYMQIMIDPTVFKILYINLHCKNITAI